MMDEIGEMIKRRGMKRKRNRLGKAGGKEEEEKQAG